MEYYIAQKIKDAWGKKPCEHPHLEKEFYGGAFLVNWVCTQCGKEFTISEKLEMDLIPGKSHVNKKSKSDNETISHSPADTKSS